MDLTGLLFETAGDGGGDRGAPPEPPAAPPEAPPAAASEGAGSEGEAWTGPSREEWDSVSGTLQGLQPLIEALESPGGFGADPYGPQTEQQAGHELRMPDPMLSDNYEAEMAAYLEDRDQRLLATLRPVTEEVFNSRAEQVLNGALEALPEELRDLGLGADKLPRAQEAITNLASAFLPPEIEQIAAQRPDLLPVVLQKSVQQAGEYL